jgi:phage N-6-adenine-methyltransferase
MNEALLSSKSIEWATPRSFFDPLEREFNFDLDVCATQENKKCLAYFCRMVDGLSQPWAGRRCWMNPPYGREIGHWMRKALLESMKGALVVCLVPARTDTAWWHDYATRGEIRFIRGRITFDGAPHPAPFPSAIVIFRPVPVEKEVA